MKCGTEMAVPPLFTCPISLDLFKDPVTLCTGQTYDRFHIEKWLSAGNLTCPVTMQKLDDLSMVPNHTLRHLISQWIQSSSQIQLDCFESIDNHLSFDSMKRVIESDESTLENRLQVLEKIHSLSQEQPLISSYCLIRLDFFELLFELALRNARDLHFQESLVLVEKSLVCALKLLPFWEMRGLNVLKEDCKFEGFLYLFEKGSFSIKKSLCSIVVAISSSVDTQELCKKLAISTKISKGIVHLMISHESEASEAAIRAMSALSSLESNRENLVQVGAVQGLISYISNLEKHEKNMASMAMSTIEKLLSVETAKGILMSHPFGVESLVKMVFRVCNHEGSESAVNSLLIICCGSRIGSEKGYWQWGINSVAVASAEPVQWED